MSDINPSDNIESIQVQRLRRKLGDLEPIHEPESDLWSGIESSIRSEKPKSKTPSWMPFALAASLILTVSSIGFSGFMYFNQTNSDLVASKKYVGLIEQPYTLARAAYIDEIESEQLRLRPEMKQLLYSNLEVIDKAVSEIRAALELNPDNPLLLESLVQTREKEIKLLKQITAKQNTTI